MGNAVKGGLIGRVWVVAAEHPNGTAATLRGNDYTATIHVSFDIRQVIRYVDSTNLKYAVKKNEQRMIHTNDMDWMTCLSDDIGRNLQVISAAVGV